MSPSFVPLRGHSSGYIFTCIIFKMFFKYRPLFKSLLNLLQYCFCFLFWFLGPKACGIIAPQPGIKPDPPALPGKSLTVFSFHANFHFPPSSMESYAHRTQVPLLISTHLLSLVLLLLCFFLWNVLNSVQSLEKDL